MHRALMVLIVSLNLALLISTMPTLAPAMDVAPRITDREIVERLARLEEGLKALDQRITDTNQRITDFQHSMDQRFADTNQRISNTNQRITDLQQTMVTLFGSLIALFVALFGYIAWDRRTMFRPIRDRLERIEEELRIEPDRPVPSASPRVRRPVDAKPPDASAHGVARA